MEDPNKRFTQGLTFDDILLVPGYSDFSRSDIDLSTFITKNIKLNIPFVSSPMDTVTESELAIALAEIGGIGIIHRNLSIADQAKQVAIVKKKKLLVGAAIGTSLIYKDRAKALINAGVDVVVVDSAHGFSKPIIEAVKYLRKIYPKLEIIAGNIATYDGAKALIASGANGLRVGMGPGTICTTRVISGMGVPQITALLQTCRAAKSAKIPIIADGGIKYSGDMVKALAAGASAVMMGSFFASASEAPGEILILKREEVPQRFQSIFNHTHKTYKFKQYRGMGSIAAMEKGAKVKSEDEYHGKTYKDRVLVAEGVEGLVPIRGTVKDILDQAIGGMKSGMYYVGAKTIRELWQKSQFIQITQASLTESHPHSILVTNPGKNYE
ncbi:MAG: IMP dehydrogenase [Candidatus Levybacteria bacterium]|nr:IMP dehydrogenase [Candidatus Levybacteria bacterium]